MPEDRTVPFAHLHVHTHYSLLDGANRIDELVARAKALDQPAVAITDHGNMFGAIEFYQAAVDAGVKPIIGMEAYIAPGDRRNKDATSVKDASYHLLLLAMDQVGYRNLLKLTSIGYREGFYYKPRIDREVLEQFSQGLICTSTCLGAEIPQALIKHDRATAEDIADWYLKVFGVDRFFIELQDHGIDEQRMINPELIEIANRRGIGMVVTNDAHYLTHEDVEAHDVLCCISTRALQDEENRFKFPTDQFYLKSSEEMASLFPKLPEAVSNTIAISERCNVEFDFNKRYTPVYHPPEEKTAEDYLRELVYQGAEERYGEITTDIRDRIDYELEVIQSKGFSSYFLICWDFVHYARSKEIPCGARGSGCSSIVAFCLFLSQPDPLHYGLYFERFMDPDRDEMPDIDIDICQDGREEIIRYVREKYGHVAQIITFGTLKARAAIRDVCRVTGVSLAEADRLAKLVPEELKMTLDKALAREPELKTLYQTDERVRKVIDIGKRLEGMARNASVHAAGVVIAEQPLDELLPLYQAPNSEAVITQYEGPTVEKVGLLKMDFLGLRTLSVLALACKLVERNHGIKLDLERLDLSDLKAYKLFAAGETKGIFQFESGGMRNVLMKMRPNRIEDLIAANALYRPGPMVNIDAYVARKHGEKWSTPHPIMDDVLAETYGIIVYQEQVARLAIQLGGIERKRAFRLAKAISKKKTAAIEAEREPFIEGAVKQGVRKKVTEDIFNQILPFGEYAFNKAHSTGYALVAFQTAYLKTYYPLEFMAALMTYDMGDTDKIVEYREECARLGIDVKPPDINTSNVSFTTVYPENGKNYLRFGLAAIKGVGEKAVQCVVDAREKEGPFKDLYDFCERIDLTVVNRGVSEALIKAGSFDSTGAMRKALTNVLEKALQVGSETQRDRESGQMSMFDAFGTNDSSEDHPAISNEEWTEAEMLAHEKSVLGFYVTSHPLTAQVEVLEKYATANCRDLVRSEIDPGEAVIGGMISRVRMVTTKNGRNAGSKLAVLTFEDLTGSIEAVVFSEELEKHRDLIAPDNILFLKGQVDRKREEPSLRVSEVISLEDGPIELSEAIIIRVSAGQESSSLERLHEICRAHPGDRTFFIQIQTSDAATTLIRCGAALSVRPDEKFVSEVETLLGKHAVDRVGRRRIKPSVPTRTPPPGEASKSGKLVGV
ncbi:MAG: DNA polymerase III subunit alpha [Phycisphaerales bacterium]|nr:DNA polymerase III subunit alpha [Phycisphaerales bacterium]